MELLITTKTVLSEILTATFSLAETAACFLFLSAFLNRKQLVHVLIKCFPRSLPFNYFSYCFDILITLPILVVLFNYIVAFTNNYQLHLIPHSLYESFPTIITGLLVVFIGDMIGYFRHRLEHTKILWPVHLMHHSDATMTWFTLFRFHPLNRLTTITIDSCVLLLLGFPVWALILNGLVRHYYGMFIHADLPWDYGKWLSKIFVSPAMHRWHHVLEGRGIRSNYATVFSVFDRTFNTYYVPGKCESELGVKGHSNNACSFFSELLHPIKSLYFSLNNLIK